MRRELPDCPKCGESDLFIVRSKSWAVTRCYECGWSHTFMPRPSEDTLHDAIAVAVAQAAPPKEHCHQ